MAGSLVLVGGALRHQLGSGVRQLLSRWKGHGIITRQATPDCVRLLHRRGLPAVDLSNFLPQPLATRFSKFRPPAS